MAHTMAVHNKNYKATKGINESAQAHQAMETLRKQNVASCSNSMELVQPRARKRWNDVQTERVLTLSRIVAQICAAGLWHCCCYGSSIYC